MSPWLALIIFIIVVLIVWWALTRNAKKYKPDFEVHPHEAGHAVEAEPAPAVEAGHAVEEAGIPVVEAVQAVEKEPAPAVAEMGAIAPPTRMTESAPTEPLKPDDLTVLEGIGPKVNQLLQEAGIRTFAQLAVAPVSELKAILVPAGLQFIDPSSWGEQAKLAADGKFDELKILTGSLRGGRKVN
jgi:predicted flap endonuclease-1-like 5' DNA nuclease